MSLNELFALLGKLGVSTRTGAPTPPTAPVPTSAPMKRIRCLNCGTVRQNTQNNCQCRSCPLRQTICKINRTAPSSTSREQSLMNILRTEPNLLGIILSKRTGKCIGIINQRGMIKHCDGKAALGPYRIMIKPSTRDAVPISSANKKAVLGQCVDKKGKTVAEIVRKHNRNQIVLAKKSKAPVIATILPTDYPVDVDVGVDLNQIIRESKALIDSL